MNIEERKREKERNMHMSKGEQKERNCRGYCVSFRFISVLLSESVENESDTEATMILLGF